MTGETGDEEGQDGQDNTHGDNGGDYHDRLPSLADGYTGAPP